MSKKENKVQAYLEPKNKEWLLKFCKDTGRSESNAINMFVKEAEFNRTAFKSSDTAIFNQVTGFDPETGDPDKLSNRFAKARKEELNG